MRFDSYIAMSALRRSSAMSSPVEIAMPMLALTVTGRASSRTGAASAAPIRSASLTADCSSPPGCRNPNSSPLRRATVSPGPATACRPLRDRDQELVPRGVPEAVVDRLEVVQVDEQAGGGTGELAQTVEKELAVREAGEAVVHGAAGVQLGELAEQPRDRHGRDRAAGIDDHHVVVVVPGLAHEH